MAAVVGPARPLLAVPRGSCHNRSVPYSSLMTHLHVRVCHKQSV